MRLGIAICGMERRVSEVSAVSKEFLYNESCEVSAESGLRGGSRSGEAMPSVCAIEAMVGSFLFDSS